MPQMRTHLRTLLVVALAVGLFTWFLSHAHLAGVWQEIARGRLDLLALALVATLATYALRSQRWKYLLDGIGPTTFGNRFRTTVIGFAASFLLPARVGEVLRPYLLAREEKLSAAACFATVILERVFDMVTVLMFFAAFLLLFDPGLSEADPAVFRAIKVGGLGVAGATVALLGVFFFLAGRPAMLARLSFAVERLLPGRIGGLAGALVRTFAQGLTCIRSPRQLAMVMIWSVPLWMSIAAGIWLVSLAFHIDVPYTGAFLLMAVLVVGVAVPTPGAVGGFHEAYRIGVTSFYHAPNDRAVGAAIVLHAISFVPVTLLGILFMAREGLTLGRARQMAAGGGVEEASR
jgi:glycosyltransferase 2 family protein